MPDFWSQQYMSLNYVNDNAFSDVMNKIGLEKLSLIVDNLPNDKAAGLKILNKLWKHCGEEVLVCLLRLLNLCLSLSAVLVNTICKILSKILFDQISLACSRFNVFCGDNFLVLKNILIQSLIRSVVENVLKKNRKLWLVLQDMYKAYDSIGWHYLIFYDPLLCKVKRHKHLCKYKIDFRFMVKSGKIETSGEKTFFLAAGVFIDDTIWGELHQYLGIFLLTEGLFKPSLVQAYVNVRFFSNIVLRKAIIDKLFCYLVLAVLQLIINIIIRKSLRAKTGLPRDFSNKFEGKLVSLILFSNGYGILECLFDHKFLDLQVLEWSFLNLLQFLVRLYVSSVNNFLTGVVKIFLENELSLANNLPCAFCESGNFLMSNILDQFLGFVPYWFLLMSDFMNKSVSLEVRAIITTRENVLSVLNSNKFSNICNNLLKVWSNCIEVYTDGSLRCAGSVKVVSGMATYFLAVNVSIKIKVAGLLFSILTELQAVTLALKCVPSSCFVVLYSDSQFAIDACISKAFFTTPNFHNQY
ncbi:hypothetical protein G9A89_002527 [Geosiphon pyriformis]|nr:hypothetical protein G9A89_002527 [Geosiphon pyriformis]